AADVERPLHVVADVVEQPDGEIRDERPRLAHVVRHGEPAVVADDQVIRVAGIDPDGVHVVVNHHRRIGLDRLARVDGHVQADAAHVDAIRVVGIDAHLAEVHRPRIHCVDATPGLTAVIGAIESRDAAGGAASAAARTFTATGRIGGRCTTAAASTAAATAPGVRPFD